MTQRITILLLLLVCMVATPVFSEIPQVINYQGKVTDTGGVPIADGIYPMRFFIYTSESGGSFIWDSGARLIAVQGGIFSVTLGESPQPAINLAFDQDYWLETVIAGDIQSPRGRLGSAGYAYMASGLVPGTSVSGTVTGGSGLAVHNTATTAESYGLYGATYSDFGFAVAGIANSPNGVTYGLYTENASTDGRGVYGWAMAETGLTYGVLGMSESTSGRGVAGSTTATSGVTYGVFGQSESPSGCGIYGLANASSGINYGVYGATNSTTGYAGYFNGSARVTGDMTVDGTITASGIGDITSVNAGTYLTGGATEGDATLDLDVPLSITEISTAPIIDMVNSGTGDGVRAIVWSTSGTALHGTAQAGSGAAYGVEGETSSTSGIGVYGIALASSGSTQGVWGVSNSTSGRGVVGKAAAFSGTAHGVEGVTQSTDGRGVHGLALATTGVNYGVYGTATSTNGFGVYYEGGLGGVGLMRNIVETSRGPTGLDVHTTAGNWVEDFGEGRLERGRTHIELDPVYLETVTIDESNPLKVFVQLNDDCKGTYVKTGATGFDVFELESGTSNARFTYRVVAAKKGFENRRLEVVTVASEVRDGGSQ